MYGSGLFVVGIYETIICQSSNFESCFSFLFFFFYYYFCYGLSSHVTVKRKVKTFVTPLCLSLIFL